MPAGLRVWGPSGDLWVDTSSYLSRIYGNGVLGPGYVSRPCPELNGQGTPFAIQPDPNVQAEYPGSNIFYWPIAGSFYFSGSTPDLIISYPFSGYDNPYTSIYWGAY